MMMNNNLSKLKKQISDILDKGNTKDFPLIWKNYKSEVRQDNMHLGSDIQSYFIEKQRKLQTQVKPIVSNSLECQYMKKDQNYQLDVQQKIDTMLAQIEQKQMNSQKYNKTLEYERRYEIQSAKQPSSARSRKQNDFNENQIKRSQTPGRIGGNFKINLYSSKVVSSSPASEASLQSEVSKQAQIIYNIKDMKRSSNYQTEANIYSKSRDLHSQKNCSDNQNTQYRAQQQITVQNQKYQVFDTKEKNKYYNYACHTCDTEENSEFSAAFYLNTNKHKKPPKIESSEKQKETAFDKESEVYSSMAIKLNMYLEKLSQEDFERLPSKQLFNYRSQQTFNKLLASLIKKNYQEELTTPSFEAI